METPDQKPLKELGLPKDKVEGLLACNPSFMGPGPAAGPGMDQADVDKWWTGQKAQLVNQVVFDLRKCELFEGNDFATEVNFIITRQLHSTNWLAKCGWRSIWKSMLQKARAKAFQDLQRRNATPVHVAAQQAAFEAEMKSRINQIKNKATT